MTISYPITLPTSPLPRHSRIRALNAVATSRSPTTFTRQSYFWGGAAWALELSYPPMRRATAEQFIAIFMQLKSAYGTFYAGDYDARTPRGIATGTPLVKGASQTGDVLETDGWTFSKTGIMKAGDYMQIGSGASTQLYKVLADANSDGSGNASLTVWPPLGPLTRSSPADNAVITVSNCKGVFALDGDFEWSADEVSTYGFSVTATESPS